MWVQGRRDVDPTSKGANMNDTAIAWHRRLYDRLSGWGGLIMGLTIGAVAFGASTVGAGPTDDLQDPGGQQRIDEECAEGCDSEEKREWVVTGEFFLEDYFAPPPPTTIPVRVVANQ
jgi:hypothetical protein